MAFNLQTFKTRALTAVVFVAVMLVGLLWNHWSFLVLFTIIHFGSWFEYQRLVGLIDRDYSEISGFHKYGIMLAGYAIMLWMTSDAYRIGDFRLHEIGWFVLLICGVVLPITEVLFSKHNSIKVIGYSLAGLLYISLSWGFLMELRDYSMMHTGNRTYLDFGPVIPLVLIASIWINDTMAYIVGSFIGKTPFSPISPKKTWEGTIGGAILCVAVVTLLGYYAFGMNDVYSLIIISAIAATVGTAGDLFQSKLKRLAGVKDSGNFMPGHGGFLDRFDSLILATPFVWLYVKAFL